MGKEPRYHPLVAEDLASAVKQYDNISVDLGNRFRASVRSRVRFITDHPESYARIHEQLRVAMVERFPYVVVYEQEEGAVAILGVFHAASDRESWFQRVF
jgi:plasmid stabilization system protein ParE